MDGNTVAALVVGIAELDRDTVAAGKWIGWMETRWWHCWRGE
jgi:hypothetical protein